MLQWDGRGELIIDEAGIKAWERENLNRAHISAVNKLIPEARSIADDRVKLTGKTTESRPGADGQPSTWCFWSEYFHEAMTDLTISAGLRI